MRSIVLVTGLLAFGYGGSQKQEAPPHNTTGPAEASTQDPAWNAAEYEAQVAKIEAEHVQAKVMQLELELTIVQARIDVSIDKVQAAQTQADREAATAELTFMQTDQKEISARLADAKAKAAPDERKKGARISKECQDNPMAKECI